MGEIDLLLGLLFLVGIGFGSQSSESASSQERGLSVGNRDLLAQPLFRATGTPNIFGVPQESQAQFLERRLFQTPTLPGLSSFGLYPQQQTAFDESFRQAISQALNKFSGSLAQRGFLRPENIGAIAGSAAQNVLPQLLPQLLSTAGANVVNQLLLPEQVTSERARQLQNFQALLANLITGSGTGISTGQSGGWNVNVGGSGGGIQGLASDAKTLKDLFVS